jgi:hypothetical protein
LNAHVSSIKFIHKKSQLYFSEYANQAFDVVKMQEQTKQLEIQKQMKVYFIY